MTYKKKIEILMDNGFVIKYHYWQGNKQRRLFIDEIEGECFNTRMDVQQKANRKINEMMEALENEYQ